MRDLDTARDPVTCLPPCPDIPGMDPTYDTTARPISTGIFGTGNRSFGSNETYIIYEAPGSVELKGTLEDRAPIGGTAIQ
jgi:hypothetical protein